MAEKEIKLKTTVDSSEVDKGAKSIESYASQLRKAKGELAAIGQQFGTTSQQYKDQQKKVNDLKEAQEEKSGYGVKPYSDDNS